MCLLLDLYSSKIQKHIFLRNVFNITKTKRRWSDPVLWQKTSSSEWKTITTNRMQSNDLEACGMKCCCFWFHSEVKFWHVNLAYNKSAHCTRVRVISASWGSSLCPHYHINKNKIQNQILNGSTNTYKFDCWFFATCPQIERFSLFYCAKSACI